MNLKEIGERISSDATRVALAFSNTEWRGFKRRHELATLDTGHALKLWVDVEPDTHSPERADPSDPTERLYRIDMSVVLHKSASDETEVDFAWSSVWRGYDIKDGIDAMLRCASSSLSTMRYIASAAESTEVTA